MNVLAHAFPFCFVLAERQTKKFIEKEWKEMNKPNKQREIYSSVEDYEVNCYLLAPSVSQRRNISGKSYYVRRYFRGGQDFEKTMERLAVKQSYMKDAG